MFCESLGISWKMDSITTTNFNILCNFYFRNYQDEIEIIRKF